MAIINKGKLLVISGPSGAGKTSICQALRERNPSWAWSVSATTRPRRANEVNGQDYYFLSEEDFWQQIQNDAFFEYAKVHGYYYGTLKKPIVEILNTQGCCILDIDVQGARKIWEQKEYPALFIFIAPPSLEELRKRLLARASDSAATIEHRLNNAAQEIQQAHFYHYKVINVDLRKTINAVQKIIETTINS